VRKLILFAKPLPPCFLVSSGLPQRTRGGQIGKWGEIVLGEANFHRRGSHDPGSRSLLLLLLPLLFVLPFLGRDGRRRASLPPRRARPIPSHPSPRPTAPSLPVRGPPSTVNYHALLPLRPGEGGGRGRRGRCGHAPAPAAAQVGRIGRAVCRVRWLAWRTPGPPLCPLLRMRLMASPFLLLPQSRAWQRPHLPSSKHALLGMHLMLMGQELWQLLLLHASALVLLPTRSLCVLKVRLLRLWLFSSRLRRCRLRG